MGRRSEDEGEERELTRSRRHFLMGLGATGVAAGAPGLAAAVGTRGGRRAEKSHPLEMPDELGLGRRKNRPGGDADFEVSDAFAALSSGPDDGIGAFIRMFDGDAFAEPTQRMAEALVEVGRPGGIMDAGDDFTEGPEALLTDPALQIDNPDNPSQTAGMTYVGQFIDHDLTLDAGSLLGVPTSASSSSNLRSARFDLHNVYGGGPAAMPELFRADGAHFRVESGGIAEDLPRTATGTAIVADHRDDENVMISGLHAAFLKFHNAVEKLTPKPTPDTDVFAEAQRSVRWHYQWIVLHEILPAYVGSELVEEIRREGRRHFRPKVARIPLEFQGSAYRFGHSMIRPSYRVNLGRGGADPFVAPVFDPDEFRRPDPSDLSGGHRAARRFVDWESFFDFGDGQVTQNKRISTRMSSPMFDLPPITLPSQRGEALGPTSLAARNLLRHVTWRMPSGQDIAEQMGVERLTPGDLSDIGDIEWSLGRSTPLWFYILREAEVFADGLHLGPVGGRIIAEVFLGLLELDPTSWVAIEPDWTPTLPSADRGQFTMIDLLTVAGVDPASRHR